MKAALVEGQGETEDVGGTLSIVASERVDALIRSTAPPPLTTK